MKAARSRRATHGFTIVEILIAASITVVVMALLWQIWTMVAKGSTTQIWSATAASRLTVSDTRIREYVAGAGYPTVVTPQGITEPGAASLGRYLVSVSTASTAIEEAVAGGGSARHVRQFNPSGSETAGVPVLAFWRLRPGSVGVEGRPTAAIVGSFVRLLLGRGHRVLDGGAPLADLIMEESVVQGAAPTLPLADGLLDGPLPTLSPTRYTMVSDIFQIRISACARDAADPANPTFKELAVTDSAPIAAPCTIRIELDALEPTYGKRHVYKKVEADTHIGVAMGVAL